MKKRGRPPKNGVVGPEHFLRALKVIHAYSKARESNQKHIAAVQETVELVSQFGRKKSISESAVKRVLAEFRPRDGQIELKAECLIREGEDAAGRRSFLAQNPELAGTESTTNLVDKNLLKPLKSFRFGFGKRVNYPRHNARTSNS